MGRAAEDLGEILSLCFVGWDVVEKSRKLAKHWRALVRLLHAVNFRLSWIENEKLPGLRGASCKHILITPLCKESHPLDTWSDSSCFKFSQVLLDTSTCQACCTGLATRGGGGSNDAAYSSETLRTDTRIPYHHWLVCLSDEPRLGNIFQTCTIQTRYGLRALFFLSNHLNGLSAWATCSHHKQTGKPITTICQESRRACMQMVTVLDEGLKSFPSGRKQLSGPVLSPKFQRNPLQKGETQGLATQLRWS